MDSKTIFIFFVSVLATWRLSSLFAREAGPFNVFGRLRVLLYRQSVYNRLRVLFGTLSDGINCMWCNSVWAGLLLSPFIAKNLFEWLVIGLALSTLTIFVEGFYDKSLDKDNPQS